MKGYKVFNNDWTCRGFQYKVGETFECEDEIKVCGNGFHFCQKANNCFNHYSFDSNNKVAEVEAIGEVLTEGDKSVTDRIKIIREISWFELLDLINMGEDNVGRENVGNRNVGRRNVGNRNVGDLNIGSDNVGNRNVGCGNISNNNTGDWNVVNYSSDIFSTIQKKIKIFDVETNLTMDDWMISKASWLLRGNFKLTTWVFSTEMTEKEKKENPSFETTGGYLKKYEYKEAWENMWNEFTEDEKQIIKDIPNFNSKKFELITGIRV